MSVRTIIAYPDPIYMQKATTVTTIDDSLKNDINDLKETLFHHKALGLGANMVGLTQRIIIVVNEEKNNEVSIMINPVITPLTSRKCSFQEATLSMPSSIRMSVERHHDIQVDYLDENGEQRSIEAHGWYAVIIQHETDYLNGITIIDRQKPFRQRLLKEKINRLRKKS